MRWILLVVSALCGLEGSFDVDRPRIGEFGGFGGGFVNGAPVCSLQ